LYWRKFCHFTRKMRRTAFWLNLPFYPRVFSRPPLWNIIGWWPENSIIDSHSGREFYKKNSLSYSLYIAATTLQEKEIR
jgi:hypothetical protein